MAKPYMPKPDAMPMPAVTHSPLAVVSPRVRESRNIIMPAPRNPMPTTMFEAICAGLNPLPGPYRSARASETKIKTAAPIETKACVFIPASLCTKSLSAPIIMPKKTATNNRKITSLFCAKKFDMGILYNHTAAQANIVIVDHDGLTRSDEDWLFKYDCR